MKKKVLVVIMCIGLLFTACDQGEKSVSGYGEVYFTVIDGFSGMPIEGVRIVIPECEQEALTGSGGKTAKLTIPVVKGDSNCLTKEFGTFSVLGYKEGYNEYALFFAQINEGQQRNIKMYMFKKDTPLSSGTPLATIESPDKDWVSELVEKFRE